MVHPGLVRYFSNPPRAVNAAGCTLSKCLRPATIEFGRAGPAFRCPEFPRSIESRMAHQQIQTHAISNGLTLIIEPMADVQSAAFSLLIPAGSNYDPPGREGAASVLVDWIMRGAGERDSMQLTSALDNLGLQRNEGVGNSHLSFTGATLADSLPAALAVYADIVQRPRLPTEEFEAARVGVEQSLKAIEDEPRQKVMIELRRRCYEAPWGVPSEG